MVRLGWILRRFFLGALSLLWATIYRARRNFYQTGIFESFRFDLPTFSIGNLVFGGSGKTPLAIWLENFLADSHVKAVISTRGYKGDFENDCALLKAKEVFRFQEQYWGDEATLMAQKLKLGAVVVGKSRYENLRYYLSEVFAQAIILEDGFQHLKIKRDLDIVVFDATRPMNQLKTAPLGQLREGLSSLRFADVVVMNRVNQVRKEHLQETIKLISPYCSPQVLWVKSFYQATELKNIHFLSAESVESLSGKMVYALAGLANPHAFFYTIQEFGANIQEVFSFPDHHFFTPEEINPILDLCEKNKAWLLVTEKDLVKLRKVTQSKWVRALEITVKFSEGEREFKDLILKIAKRRPF